MMGNKQAKHTSNNVAFDGAQLKDVPKGANVGATTGKTAETAFDQYAFPFENAVFEGGPGLLLPYVGAVRFLEEAGIWRNITRLAGSGSGSVIASLLALGYNSHQLERFFQNDLRTLTQDHCCGCCCLGCNLRSSFGWSPNKKIIGWFKDKITASAGKADITFLEVYEKFGKELCVIVTNVSQGCVDYFHHKTSPHLSIVTAMRMSLATPGLVSPVKYKLFGGEEQLYVEGGILCNYPIFCYDGWWLSLKPEDSFLNKLTSLEQLSPLLEKQSRFADYNPKTLGFVVYDENSRDPWTTKLDERNKLGDKVVSPETKLAKSQMEVRLACRMMQQKYTEYVNAASKLLRALAENVSELNKPIQMSDLDSAVTKLSSSNNEEIQSLFGTKTSADEICKLVAPTRKNQISRQDFVTFFESRALSFEAQYRHRVAQYGKVNNIAEFLEAVEMTELINSRKQHVSARDLDRTVGINIRHVASLRQPGSKLEAADYQFLVEQGRLSVKAYLESYASHSVLPIKESPNRRSFCRDDLPSFIDDDVSEIIDERDYMENLIGRVL